MYSVTTPHSHGQPVCKQAWNLGHSTTAVKALAYSKIPASGEGTVRTPVGSEIIHVDTVQCH